MPDPEYYATRQIGTPNNQLGYLEDWAPPRNAAGTWSGGRPWKGRCEAFMMPCPDWMCGSRGA